MREIARGYDGLTAWSERPDYLDHERSTGRLLVAAEGGRVIGFGAVLTRPPISPLGDLFIRPDRVGQGVGRALLEALFTDATDRTTYASGDPRALPLYVRFGMQPLWPLLYLTGDRAAAARLPAEPVELVAATPEATAELDQATSGRRRPEDFVFLVRSGGTLFSAPSIPGGYGCVRVAAVDGRPHAFVAPAGAASDRGSARLLLALLRRAGERAEVVNVPPFGPHPAVAALFAAGFRLSDRDTGMCSRPALIDPRRYVPSPDIG